MQREDGPCKRAIVLLKPGLSAGDEFVRGARASLQAHGLRVTLESPASPGEAESMLRKHAGSVDRVIVAGGDGTLHTLAAALIEARLPVGILYCGTANDLARALGVPADPGAACALIAGGRTRRIDVGRVNGVYFFNVAHIGLAVEAARQTGALEKKYLGFVAYFIGAWRAFRAQRGFRAEIVCDGVRRTARVMQVSVGNGPTYGGGNRITDGATIEDGLLDLVALLPMSGARMLALARALRAGTIHAKREALALRGTKIEVRTARARTVIADGEKTAKTPALFEVAPGALAVYAPEP